jgi:hypothetical protein
MGSLLTSTSTLTMCPELLDSLCFALQPVYPQFISIVTFPETFDFEGGKSIPKSYDTGTSIQIHLRE